ncbi:PREDICTED: uncharacterized protein LOC104748796 [Camelina sativa]|uniref:Uncharacterized protein LOC104748796 n=1 Tax=Camelina sativa TaxID=90675 RepID=A0ABM0WBL9_CAMSA|nr:PREDICTED: uncharacterized protein LOC104748796 [Camelina sativa]
MDETTEKIKILKLKMKEAQDRQKSYADKRRRELEFQVGDMVYLKTVTYKGKDRVALNTKLTPRYMGPYRILERIGPTAYKLELPPAMSAFHPVFHVSMLRKCITGRENVISEPSPDLQVNMTIIGRPVRITGTKMRGPHKKKKTKLIQVVWDCEGIEETTWEPEEVMKVNFKKWFDKREIPRKESKDSRMNQS